jgi:hypothetical protein
MESDDLDEIDWVCITFMISSITTDRV